MSTQDELRKLVYSPDGKEASLELFDIKDLINFITQQNKAAVAAFAEELKPSILHLIDNYSVHRAKGIPKGTVAHSMMKNQAIKLINKAALTPQPIKQRSDRSEK